MNGRWPVLILAVVLLVAALVFGLSRRESNSDIDALKRVLGERLCRDVAEADRFQPTKQFPKALIERTIQNLQQERADLGLEPCPRKD